MKIRNFIFVVILVLQTIPALAQKSVKDLISIDGATLHLPTDELLKLGFTREEFLERVYFTKEVKLNSGAANPPHFMNVTFSAGEKLLEPQHVYNLQLEANWWEVTPTNIDACTSLASALSKIIWQNSYGLIAEVPREQPLAGLEADNIKLHFDWSADVFAGRVAVEASCLERDFNERRILVASLSLVETRLKDKYLNELMVLKAAKSTGLEGVVN